MSAKEAADIREAAEPPPVREVREEAAEKVKHPDGTKTVNGFRVEGILGQGSFAKVKLCEDTSSAEKCALKVFRKGRLRRQRDFVGGQGGAMKIKTSLDKVYDEVAVFRRLVHPNCIQLFGIFEEEARDGKLYLVMEYAAKGATMEWDSEKLQFYVPGARGLIAEARARGFVFDALQGLAYMHRMGIAHRDIKPQNLLVAADDRLKIGDFGVAAEMDGSSMIHGTEGTYHFYPPECCRSGYDGHDGRKADIWALGVTLWAFVFGSVPFLRTDLASLFEAIAEARLELPPPGGGVGEECRGCIRSFLGKAPEDRPLASDAEKEGWLAGLSRAT